MPSVRTSMIEVSRGESASSGTKASSGKSSAASACSNSRAAEVKASCPFHSREKKPARSRVVLTDISSRAWEHPADKGALVALRKLKGFDVLLKTMSGVFRERAWRLTLLGSAVRVDERQFARLHRLLAVNLGSVALAALGLALLLAGLLL